MEQITLREYKYYLASSYKHECDNNDIQINKRLSLLNSKYDN